MTTENRKRIWESMEHYRQLLNPDNKGWHILEIGIDGDEKPSGNHKYFGRGNNWQTLDFLLELEPDIVADITDNNLASDNWDLVICSQNLEHIFDFQKAISEIFRILKSRGYAIIDCPWEFPYHGLPVYDDYWRISDTAMKRLLIDAKFQIIECKRLGCLTTALVQK